MGYNVLWQRPQTALVLSLEEVKRRIEARVIEGQTVGYRRWQRFEDAERVMAIAAKNGEPVK